jgi:hypothetical protein
MYITLKQNEIKQIILTHLEKRGFVGDMDIICSLDQYEEWIATIDIKDNIPYQPIDYPKCPKCNGQSYPRCMNLSDYKYCMRNGGVC